ncbi:MAG: class I SAM-dependent methyltransferase [Curvibacter sp.]|nr:MAG: class I SAM-dependent methyltransferase [Curvibacter sp.]
MQEWFQSPAGAYLLEWEQAQLDEAVADLFGYHALQLGIPELHALRANRIPHRWFTMQETPDHAAKHGAVIDFYADFTALPFPANSMDLLVLPHALEFSPDPHAALREVERVLVPEGKVVICGLNPASLWGWRQRRSRVYQQMGWEHVFLPGWGDLIGYWRLRDWLRLLSFEVEVGRFGCYRPAVDSPEWLRRFAWLDRMGARWWPIFGAAYFVVATKRVRGMRLLGGQWKASAKRSPAAVPVAQQTRKAEIEKIRGQ